MRPPWHQSILARAGAALIGLLLVFGTITAALHLEYHRARSEQANKQHLNQLLDTVESTASIACFTGDDILARELAAGLLRNSKVLSVTVEADAVRLANLTRPQEENTSAKARDAHVLMRDIFSPFSPQTRVGRVLLTPNQALIDKHLRDEMQLAILQTALQLLLVTLAFAAATLLLILRPIKAISGRLHQMDATRGDRLQIPAGHRGSEIGQLVADVNDLADRLVMTLEQERKLRIQREIDEQRYHAIFENAETGLFIIDDQGHLSSWNPAFSRLMQLPLESESGGKRSLFGFHWAEPARLGKLLLGCKSAGQSRSAVLSYHASDGTERWLSMVLTPIADQSIQGVISDVTEHLEAERSAKRLAVTDRLTGMANRIGLEQQARNLALIHDMSQGEDFALILISLDNFKRISAGLDPSVGDSILKETATRLSSCIKDTDLVARVGESRFALLLAGLGHLLDIESITDRVLSVLRQQVLVDGYPVTLHASAGIAFYSHDADQSVAKLIQHADLALSNAKSGGGRCLRFFDPDLARLAAERHHLETDLREAIDRDQFVLFFQPIVDLHQRQLVGAEALIRWQHPIRGLIPPDAFIPLAEEIGLISELGLWVLKTAGQQLASWRCAGRDLYLSVNVSASQIPHQLSADLLVELAGQAGFEPNSMALEITEAVLISDIGETQAWLNAVRANGFSVYLDDFGTGYSSLSYLKGFSVDRLKVDKSFVRDIATNPADQALVEAVTAIARSFDMDVIAEGVEEPGHVHLLRDMGCRYAQGYFFSRPVPIEAFQEACERIPKLFESLGMEPPPIG